MKTSYDPSKYVGLMNSFGETAVEVFGKPFRDSKGNRLQGFIVLKCDGHKEYSSYHVRELGQFSIDPNSEYGQNVIAREKKAREEYAAFRATQAAWVKNVEAILQANGMTTRPSGCHGIVHVTKGWMKDIRRILKAQGILFTLYGKVMSYDRKRVCMPVAVHYKDPSW